MLAPSTMVGTKCPGMPETLEKEENKIQKRLYDGSLPLNAIPPCISTVATKQHH